MQSDENAAETPTVARLVFWGSTISTVPVLNHFRQGYCHVPTLFRKSLPDMRAREGDFVETSDGLFFDVKGLVHPPGRIVAYLRYYPCERGTRLRGGSRYAKVYDLPQRRLLLKRRWPNYLYHDVVHGRELQGVPIGNVRALHLPKRRLGAILRSRQRDSLEATAARLVKELVDMPGISPTRLGISGSLLVGLHRPDSDIDIMVYGVESAKHIQRALFALLDEDRHFHRYQTRHLRRLYADRGLQRAIAFEDFERHERRKALQGRFLGHDYFVRCVKDWAEISERYGDEEYLPLGNCSVSAEISDDMECLLTPCRYRLREVKVLAGDSRRKPAEVFSFRGRFAEQAQSSERIFARGRLEQVRSRRSRRFRLVVGEGRTDVLRTMW